MVTPRLALAACAQPTSTPTPTSTPSPASTPTAAPTDSATPVQSQQPPEGRAEVIVTSFGETAISSKTGDYIVGLAMDEGSGFTVTLTRVARVGQTGFADGVTSRMSESPSGLAERVAEYPELTGPAVLVLEKFVAQDEDQFKASPEDLETANQMLEALRQLPPLEPSPTL